MNSISQATLNEMAGRAMAVPGISTAVTLVRSEMVRPMPRRPEQDSHSPTDDHTEVARAGLPPAEVCGGESPVDDTGPRTLQEALLATAREAPDKGIVYLQADGSEHFQSYTELLADARRVLAGLRATGIGAGDSVLFQFGDNRNFITAFWACVLGGYIPTPAAIAPRYDEDNAVTRKLRNSWDLLGRPHILTDADLVTQVRSLAALWQVDGLQAEAVETLRGDREDMACHRVEPDDPVLHLLTSGSSGPPKCVRHNNRSILAWATAVALVNDFSSDDISLSWGPLDHVGGLVWWHIRNVILQCQQICAETSAFLAEPLNWLDWADRFRATNAAGLNFAFALVNDHASEARGRNWELSCLRRIANGGETVAVKTARQFLNLLRPHGLPADAMRPMWGMSETSSAITFSTLSAEDEQTGVVRLDKRSLGGLLRIVPDEQTDSVTLAEVGTPVPGVQLRIVDAEDAVIPERHIGRLQVRGATVMAGYYRNDDANRAAFTGDGWFNTGDLAFLNEGRLTIAGREKDVIIIRGVNYLTYDVESVVEQVHGTEVTFTAACAYTPPGAQAEELAVFFVPAAGGVTEQQSTVSAIRDALARELGLPAPWIVPVPREQFPKTSVGKVQRARLLTDLTDGLFDEQLARLAPETVDEPTSWLYERAWLAEEPPAVTPPPAGVWLLLTDEPRIEEVVRGEASALAATVVTARSGPDFARVHGSAFTVRPDNREHHQLLLDAVRREHGPVTAVLHAWEAGPATEPETAAHCRCALSVLALLQALAASPAPLLVLTTNGVWARPGDTLVPVRSTLPGLIRTALTEQAVPVVRQVDLPADAPDAWAEAIRTELSCTDRTAVVAHRARERLVPRLRAVAPESAPEGAPTFVPGGTYLLTGGLGGIGQVVSEYLLSEVKAKLLLIGRSPAASVENARRLAELAALGEVDYQQADVANITALTAAVDRAERRWAQPLAGVLHLAGADVSQRWQHLEEHTLVNEIPDSFFDMCGPKVSGTLALAELLADRPGTKLVLFSSVNAEFGGLSFGAYSSVNSFLNGFADHWGREHGRPVCSISWSSWAGIGMSRGSPTDAARSRGFCAIPEEAGIRLLTEALALGNPNLIAGLDPANVNILREMLPDQLKPAEVLLAYAAHEEIDDDVLRTALGETTSDCTLPMRFMRLDQLPVDEAGRVDSDQLLAMATPGNSSGARQYVEPRTDLEYGLAAIWSDVLRRRLIGREDGFFEIGGNSVLAVQIVSQIGSKLGIKVPIHQLYENPRIGLLADALTGGLSR